MSSDSSSGSSSSSSSSSVSSTYSHSTSTKDNTITVSFRKGNYLHKTKVNVLGDKRPTIHLPKRDVKLKGQVNKQTRDVKTQTTIKFHGGSKSLQDPKKQKTIKRTTRVTPIYYNGKSKNDKKMLNRVAKDKKYDYLALIEGPIKTYIDQVIEDKRKRNQTEVLIIDSFLNRYVKTELKRNDLPISFHNKRIRKLFLNRMKELYPNYKVKYDGKSNFKGIKISWPSSSCSIL